MVKAAEVLFPPLARKHSALDARRLKPSWCPLDIPPEDRFLRLLFTHS